MRVFAAFCGFGFGVAAWQNAAPVDHPQRQAAVAVGVLAIAGLVVGSFRARRRPTAAAVAVAHGGAGGHAQVAVVFPGVTGPGVQYEALDRMPWVDHDATPMLHPADAADLFGDAVGTAQRDGGLQGDGAGAERSTEETAPPGAGPWTPPRLR